MADYRIMLHTITTGTLVAEVRPTSAKWSVGLNGQGTAQVQAPTAVLLAALEPLFDRLASHYLTVVAPDGQCEFSGPLWAADVTLDGATTLTAGGMQTVLQRRVVRTDLTYTATEQATIAAALVNHAQDTSGSRADRALCITTAGLPTTGITRTIAWPAADARPIGDALGALAEMDGGFTYAFTPTLGAGRALTHAMSIASPAGVATTAVLVHRSNCLVAQVNASAAGMVTDVVALGGGSAAKLTERRGGALAGWPCLEATRSFTDTTGLAALQAQADRALALGSAPMLAPTVQVLEAASPVAVNDLARLVVPEVGLDGTYRVMAVDTTLAGAVATSSLTLAPAELFA